MKGHLNSLLLKQGEKGDVGKDGVHGINSTKGDTGEKGENCNVIDTVVLTVQYNVHVSCAKSYNTALQVGKTLNILIILGFLISFQNRK